MHCHSNWHFPARDRIHKKHSSPPIFTLPLIDTLDNLEENTSIEPWKTMDDIIKLLFCSTWYKVNPQFNLFRTSKCFCKKGFFSEPVFDLPSCLFVVGWELFHSSKLSFCLWKERSSCNHLLAQIRYFINLGTLHICLPKLPNAFSVQRLLS